MISCVSAIGFYDCTVSAFTGAIAITGRGPIYANRLANQAADTANARAESLLLESLSELQRYDYIRRGYFEIEGQSGRRYQIGRSGTSGNVIEVNAASGKAVATWCCNIGNAGPEGDCYLAQKLYLENDEQAFLKTANRLR